MDTSDHNAMEFITHEIEMHSISPWSEEVDNEDVKMDIEYIESNASKKRKSSEMKADWQKSAKNEY